MATPQRLQEYLDQDREMVALFREGRTMNELGVRYGISRERVRQRLKRYGLKGIDGGNRARALSRARIRERAALERAERRTQAIWLCNVRELGDARAQLGQSEQRRLDHVYRMLRAKAIREHVPWQLPYPDLARLMRKFISYYGRGRDKVVLRRINSYEPYTLKNVEVVTHGESSRLTRRQEQIVRLKAARKSNSEIARMLGITLGSVGVHLRNARMRVHFSGGGNGQGPK